MMAGDWDLLRPTSLWEIQDLLQRLLCSSNLAELGKKAAKQKMLPCYDSRQLQAHHIFVALAGETFDGHQFIEQALELGVLGVVYQAELEPQLLERMKQKGIAAFRVKASRQALSLLSAHCFGYPSRSIQVLGITGTDGKTSIAYLCYQILAKNGEPVGLLSTFGLDFGRGLQPNPLHQTTPESLVVQQSLARMLANGCHFAVLECSSHGLSVRLARLMHVEFSGALFSNLSPEHLEFHGSMECYTRDKARLFSRLRAGGVAVWNASEPASETLYNASGARQDILHYGYTSGSLEVKKIPFTQMLRAENSQLGASSSQFDLLTGQERLPCKISIPGSVYISNVVGALSLCRAVLGACDLGQILSNLSDLHHKGEPYCLDLRAPKGRMELVPSEAPFSVIVDYAHSPGAFARLLPEMRALLGCSARLLLLFGSAGQRDCQKRPLQGELAARYADIIVLCNEDPREEDEMAILQDIRRGICADFLPGQNLFLIPDRRQAMARLFALAQPGDLVLLLGKGHETSIILSGHRKIRWDEQEVALALLCEYPYSCIID